MNQNNSDIRSVLNFRDAGGIPAANGGEMRKGVLYRSANPDHIKSGDINILHKMGIKTIIDLRASYEYRKKKVKIDGIEVVSLPLDFERKTREQLYPYFFKTNSEEKIAEISNSLYIEITDGAGQVLRQVSEILLEPARSPVLIHCQAGKDRTGIIIALLQLLAGADKKIIIRDYLKSNDALLPYFRKRMLLRKIITLGYFPASTILYGIAVKEKNIETVIDRVVNHYGGPEAYLARSGFDMNSLQLLRDKLID
jgi:protein-tyrosine phosphatase